MSVKSLSESEALFIRVRAYQKAWAWCAQWRSVFIVTADTVIPLGNGWIVSGTMVVPDTEVVGYSVLFTRKPNGRVGGSPIVVIYKSDLL